MKILLVAALLVFGCGSKVERPDQWPEVEKLAVPTVPAADGALLTKAIARVQGDDVPEAALEDAIAWRKAGGGLPWRGGRALEDQRIFSTYKLGDALLDRRGHDPEAVLTALYLAQRLRAEAPALIDVTVGFTLAIKATKQAPRPEYAAYAPTEAEVRRAPPADALFFLAMLKTETSDEDQTIAKAVKRAYADMVVGAPAERAGYMKRIEQGTARAQKSELLAMVISPRLPTLVKEAYGAIDAYAAWMK